jgi:hypothetical protein
LFEVGLRARQKNQNVVSTLRLHLVQPVRYVFEGFATVNWIADQDGVGVPVENFRDRAKVFLPCSVPNLQFHNFILNLAHVRVEFNAHRDLSFNEIVVY